MNKLYNELKNCWKIGICWISNRYGWTTGIAGFVFAILQTWVNFEDYKVFNYRPSNDIFFWGTVATATIVLIIGFIKSISDKYQIEKINQKCNEKIKYYKDVIFEERREALNERLREISEELKFSMQERICVYRFIEKDNEFECIGRYSKHTDLKKFSSARSRYSASMGIIAHVWNNGALDGFKRDSDFPELKKNTNGKPTKKSLKIYTDYLDEHYNIPKSTSIDFRMNSVDIIAHTIYDTKNTSVAIIIFESQRKQFLDDSNISKYWNDFRKGSIVTLLDKLQEQHSPDEDISKEVGL